MTNIMSLEEPSKNNLQKHDKSDFARTMNCSVRLLDTIDELTGKIGRDLFDENYNDVFVGNIGCRSCGRWYSENKRIWVGVFFDRLIGYKLAVGFCVNPQIPEDKSFIQISKLLSTHYNYYAEYIGIENDYWFYIFLNNTLEPCCNTLSAYEEIVKIIQEVKK